MLSRACPAGVPDPVRFAELVQSLWRQAWRITVQFTVNRRVCETRSRSRRGWRLLGGQRINGARPSFSRECAAERAERASSMSENSESTVRFLQVLPSRLKQYFA